jgi:hypothetical protein
MKVLVAGAIALLAAACASTGPSQVAGGYRPQTFPADTYGEAIIGPPRIVDGPPMECVPFARVRSGIEVFGDAYLWWQTAASAGYRESSVPQAGDVLALRIGTEGNRGHLAYVKRVVSSREIYVDHANWHGRRELAVDVPVIDVSENNDWSAVRVFWVDTGQMGARTYAADGFISPNRPGPGA